MAISSGLPHTNNKIYFSHTKHPKPSPVGISLIRSITPGGDFKTHEVEQALVLEALRKGAQQLISRVDKEKKKKDSVHACRTHECTAHSPLKKGKERYNVTQEA